ncbi:MAG: deoxyribonuclease IV [Acidobacteriota bacterium]|nr:deoxyribonuclease IV [Acidobacteriota bacterium]
MPKQHEALLGAHMSIAGGIPKSLDRAMDAGCNVLQIFVKNNNQWRGRALHDPEVQEFRQRWAESPIRQVVAHDSYLINLASPKPDLWERSIAAFLDEMKRCERLGLSHLVTHPGAHVGAGEAWGIDRIAAALVRILERTASYQVKIALETTAGQGTTLGHRFQHLRDIMAGCGSPERIVVCMDTCHVFAAGYEIRTEEGYAGVMGQFDQVVGLEKLEVLHFNDSKRSFGSRVDRHEHIGKGEIGKAAFGWFLNDPRLVQVPKLLETPKENEGEADRRNLKVLRSLLDKPEP